MTTVTRQRVVRSPDALYSPPRVNRVRRRCDGHLVDDHWIEAGALVLWSALPPDSEIGNPTWWHHAYCADCWPAEWADAEPQPRKPRPHEVRYDVDRDPDSGAVLSWSVRSCSCTTPWRHG